MVLELELETYRNRLPDLLDREGKFVLIHGSAIVGVFDTREEALYAGYEHCGFAIPFLIKQIVANERPQFFNRNVRPCPPSTAG
jgi:hypothetical protein